MSKKKPFKPDSKYFVEVEDLWYPPFFKSRMDSLCLNSPSFDNDFLEWANTHLGSLRYQFEYANIRVYNGYGNRGGWMERAQKCFFLFDDEASEMFFRLTYNILK